MPVVPCTSSLGQDGGQSRSSSGSGDEVEDEAETGVDLGERVVIEWADPFGELALVEGDDLGDVDDRVLRQARSTRRYDDIAVYDQSDDGDPIETAAQYSRGASAMVLGIGGLAVRGRNPIRPDELPNSVLRTADGELAHHVARESATDLIVVCDTITLHHGRASQVAAVAAAGAAIVGGTIAADAVGLVAATAAIALGGAAAVGRR